VEIGADLLTSLPVIVAEHRVWFAALPFSVFVAGVSLTAMSLANRMQAYRLLAIMQFAAALVSALASIALGFLRLGAEGLLTAYIVSQFILLGFSLAILARFGVIAERPRVSTLRRLALRHRGYPFFTLPGQLMQSIGLQLPVLTLTMLGATASLGSFNRAQQILFLPLSLFSAAITRVHFQNAAADYNKHGNCRPVFIKTAFVISLFAIPFMLIVLFLGEPIFTLYLGRNWSEAGRIAEIICPVFALQMFVAPLGSSLLFTGNQRLSLYIQTVGLFIAIAATTFPIEFGFDDYQILTGWTAALSALACGQIYFGWRLAKAPMRTQFEGALNA
jgi:O-antigen/teichoic acid export membrane protein